MISPRPPAPSPEVVIEADSPRLADSAGYAAIAFVAVILCAILGGIQLASVAIVVALVAGGVFLRRVLGAALRWKPAELVLPSHALAMGGSVQATYRRRPRAQRDVPACTLRGTLVCEERARYYRGTDRRTDIEQVAERQLTATGGGTPRGLEAPLVIEVPVDGGGPTMDLYNNEIRWYLEVVTEGANVPSDIQHFDVVVEPALDPAVRNEWGDR